MIIYDHFIMFSFFTLAAVLALCLSVCLSFGSLSICLSFGCLSICLSFGSLSVCLSLVLCLSVCLWFFVCFPFCRDFLWTVRHCSFHTRKFFLLRANEIKSLLKGLEGLSWRGEWWANTSSPLPPVWPVVVHNSIHNRVQ